jgi:hypothetical protein
MNADLKKWESVCKGRWGALEAVLLADDAANAVDRRSYLGLLARARRNIGQEDRAAHCAAHQGHPKRSIDLCPRSSASMGKYSSSVSMNRFERFKSSLRLCRKTLNKEWQTVKKT